MPADNQDSSALIPTALPSAHKTIAVALTGASGMPYGLRLVECLLAAGCRVWLLYSQVAQIVARQEMDIALPARPEEVEAQLGARFKAAPGQLRVFGREEWFAPPASGSNPPDAMVVCPCTMGTLASIAAGLAGNLIERAADVVIKEGRKLILVPGRRLSRPFTWRTCCAWRAWAWSSCPPTRASTITRKPWTTWWTSSSPASSINSPYPTL
jgi:polyprenyl P-hydroxybenzoate/phenylacrylic acid decarboxylase-like protein